MHVRPAATDSDFGTEWVTETPHLPKESLLGSLDHPLVAIQRGHGYVCATRETSVTLIPRSGSAKDRKVVFAQSQGAAIGRGVTPSSSKQLNTAASADSHSTSGRSTNWSDSRTTFSKRTVTTIPLADSRTLGSG